MPDIQSNKYILGGSSVFILELTSDPTVGAGEAAPIGSVGCISDGSLWQKTGLGNNAWVRVTTLDTTNQNNYEVYASSALVLSAVDVVIPMDTEEQAKTLFSLVFGSVEINFSGRIRCWFSVSADATNGTRSVSRSTLYQNGIAINRSFTDGYHRNVAAGENTASKMILLDVVAGDFINVRSRILGGNGTVTIADGCNMVLERIA